VRVFTPRDESDRGKTADDVDGVGCSARARCRRETTTRWWCRCRCRPEGDADEDEIECDDNQETRDEDECGSISVGDDHGVVIDVVDDERQEAR
jgi:hypothetical protein